MNAHDARANPTNLTATAMDPRIPAIDALATLVHGVMPFALIFISTWIVLSIFAGYTIGISWAIPLVALVVTSFLMPREKIPSTVTTRASALIPLLAFFLFTSWAAGTLFITQQGFDLSADATPAIVTALIGERIPMVFEGYYSDLPFLYQLGLPVIASQLAFTGISPHLVLWLFALVGMLFTFYYLSLHAEKWIGGWASVLFVCVFFLGTRFPFLNILVGEYPWMLALGMALGGMWMWKNHPVLGGIIFGATWAVHPYIAIGGLLFLAIVERMAWRAWAVGLIAMGVLAIPSLVFQLLPFISGGKTSLHELAAPGISSILGGIALMGIIPFLAGVVLALLHGKKMPHDPLPLRWTVALLLIFGTYLAAQFIPSASFASKILQWGSIALVFIGTWLLAQKVDRQKAIAVACVLLLFAGGVIFISHDMQRLSSGSKSSLRDAHFAEAFKRFDSTLARTLFLSPAGGKIAQYADKIPLHTMNANFVLAVFVLRTPEAIAYRETAARIDAAIRSRCVECLDAFPAQYWVIDTRVFPPLSDREPLFAYDGFLVYSGMPLSFEARTNRLKGHVR